MTRKRKAIQIVPSDVVDRPSSSENSLSFECDHAFMREFEQKYGYINDKPNVHLKRNKHHNYESRACVYDDVMEQTVEPQPKMEEKLEFPSELVAFIENLAKAIEENLSEKEIIIDRCLKECEGHELTLFSFNNCCRLVESMFINNRSASLQWMNTLMNVDDETRLRFLQKGSVCRTLETFTFALSQTLDAEILSNWIKFAINHWEPLIFNRNSNRFVRSLIRHVVGLPKTSCITKDGFTEPKYMRNATIEKKTSREFSSNNVMKECFTLFADKVFDHNWMLETITKESVSLVMQDLIECDYVVQGGYAQATVRYSLNHPEHVLNQWKEKQASRIWEKLVCAVDEYALQSLFHAALNGHLVELALDDFANFPLQKCMLAAKSDELITDICDELIANVDKLCISGKLCVVAVLIQTCRGRQQELLDHLRQYFDSDTEATETLFLPNVFTLKDVEVKYENGSVMFDANKGKFHGSFLLQQLIGMSCNETVLRGFRALHPQTTIDLANNQSGSYMFQAVFKSSNVAKIDKQTIAKPLKDEWRKIVDGKTSSYVFEVAWDHGIFTITEKERIMNEIINITRTKILHRVCIKLKTSAFKQNRKKWLEDEKYRMKKMIAEK